MNQQTAQVDDLRLVALPSAVNCTELFVRFSLTEWALRDMLNDTTAAAQRLVGSVIEHTDPANPGFVTVRLRLTGDALVVEVEDDQPALARAGAPQVPGRQTGVVPIDGRGRLVWCELPLPPGITGDSRLPRRGDRRPMTDPVPASFPEALHTPGPPLGAPRVPSAPGAPGGADEPGPAPVDPALADRVLVGLKRRQW